MMSPVKATLFVGSPFSWVDLNETNKFEKFYVKVALCEERHFFLFQEISLFVFPSP